MTQKKRILFVGEASFLNTGFSTYYRELLPRLVATGKYEIAELGSYAKQDDPRVQEFIAGRWKFYGVMPMNDEEARAFQQPNPHPRTRGQNTNQFGEYKFAHAVADFKPDIVIDIRDHWMLEFQERNVFRPWYKWCFPAGTPVITGFGKSKNIEDILIGDYVESHKGKSRKVTNISNHYYNGMMTKICAEGMAEPLISTSDHEILVVRKPERCWNNNKRSYETIKSVISIDNANFIKASEISIGDYLLKPISRPDYETEGIGIDSETLWIIGCFLADGCARDKNRVSFAFHKDEIDTQNRVIQYFMNLDIMSLRSRQGQKDIIVEKIASSDNGVTLRINSKKQHKFFAQFYDDNGNKCLPQHFSSVTDDEIIALTQGYFDGDGCVTRTNHNTPSIEMFSKSKVLARQITELLCRLGHPVRLGTRSTQEGYTIRISGETTNIFDKELISNSSRSTQLAKKSFTRVINKQCYIFMPVISIENYQDNLQVYDIEVMQDNSFITHCAVHNCIMPTVDAEPQQEEWIQTYENANMVLSYSDYGINTLRRQSSLAHNGKRSMRIFPKAMRPGVDIDTFKPADKKSIREHWNLAADVPIIGTVMRNQSRKLYPDLIDAFALMKNKYKGEPQVDKAVLLIHSCWPDNVYSYDYPRHIYRLERYDWLDNHKKGIRSDVLQSLYCHSCKQPSVTFAMNMWGRPIQEGRIKMPCCYCGKIDASPPSSMVGFGREDLASLYNLMDLYVQCSICEGDGMPIQEAKACGVPTLVVDYTAMREKGRYPNYSHFEESGINENNYTCHKGGDVIKVGRYYYEPETSCKRALPDIEDLALKMRNMINDKDRLEELKKEARQCVVDNYDWDKLWKQWEYVLDNVKILDRSETWDSPIAQVDDIKSIPVPSNLNDEQYVSWLYLNILKYPSVDTDGAKMWISHLQQGVTRDQLMQQFVSIGNQQASASKLRDQVRIQMGGVANITPKKTQEFV